MDTQISLKPMIVFMLADQPVARQVQACSRDYGFDFDEDEIGAEMLAPLPAGLITQITPEDGSNESDFVQLEFLA